MSNGNTGRLIEDIRGGAISATVSIPLAIGYGMFAFVTLGDAYFGFGIMAGLTTALAATLVCLVLGDRTATLYAPRILTTFYLGALLYALARSPHPALRDAGVPWILCCFFAIIFLGGAFQAAFGALRLGSIIKYIPHPVLAGFHNAGALLLFLVQIGTVLGYEQHVPFSRVLAHLDRAHPGAALVALAAFLAAWHAKKWLPRVPPVVSGLAAGTLTHYALASAGAATHLGPLLGMAADAAPSFSNLAVFHNLAQSPHLVSLLPLIAAGALGLALVASIDTLLCARILEGGTGIAPDPDRQLLRLGLANAVSASAGGITASFNLGPTLAQRAYGGRGALAVLVNCALTFAAMTLLLPLIAWLPRAALSGVIMVIAIQHFDPWTTLMLRRFASGRAATRAALAFDLAVVLLVAMMAIVLDIVTAVFIGVAITFVLFVYRLGSSIVRDSYRCDTMRSRKTRLPLLVDYLNRTGAGVLVLELEGAVFFGSAERLGDILARELREPTSHVILDLRRITEIDSTGSQSLVLLQRRLDRAGVRLILSGLREAAPWQRMLADHGVLDAIGARGIAADIDRAIESAEEDLLARAEAPRVSDAEIPLARVDLLTGMGEEEREVLGGLFARRTYAAGDVIFREGEPGDELFVIARGSASVRLAERNGGEIRLVTFEQGTVFGELAILDRQRRSATVTADGDLVCWVLSHAHFAQLRATSPTTAVALALNLGREMSLRLRLANRTIRLNT